MADEHEREEGQPHEILISDKRHSREIEDSGAEPPEPEEAPAPAQADEPPPAPPAGEAQAGEPAQGAGEVSEPAEKAPPPPPTAEADSRRPRPDDSPEAAQLRLLFEAGLPAYLHSQLQLLLNFAMIYLGRQPNPANGLVTTNLDHARLAIDLFDFIVKRTQGDLPEQDRAGLANLISSLKMEYTQAAQGSAKPPSGATD